MPSWPETLAALRGGELEARDRVVRLVVSALQSFGAYDQRDSWDDVVQDVLLTLLRTAPRSLEDAAVAAWVRRVAIHRYLDELRKEQGRRRAGSGPTSGWRRNVQLEEAHLADEKSLDGALRHDLAVALRGLDPRKRRILDCKYALGCTDAEGAERLGESLGTYKRLVREALGELRRGLTQSEQDESTERR